MKNLVVVESPTKARTLSRFLGDDYQIEASMGHIRDLPKSEIGIDIEHNFEPHYIIPKDKQKTVSNLKKLAAGADNLWLATDPDREGEAIAWHLSELLKGKGSTHAKRVEFHEITPEAIKAAFAKPRSLDTKLVDAQQGRRVLDRLVGYKLSPLLWKKVKSGLSAGRVQSVAVRLIVEREREIEKFKPVEYWTIEALVESKDNPGNKFPANLVSYQGKKLEVHTAEESQKHQQALEKAEYVIAQVTKKETKKHPAPPFTTSTMQQDAANRLNLSAKKTMSLAQFLYEQGLITYMRTDSVNLAPVALAGARDYVSQKLGKEYLPEKSRVFKTKSKSAQEAHEAIRPTNMMVTADELKTQNGLSRDHVRLYDLIWKRMIASQMAEALMDQTSVDVKADDYGLKANGSVIKFEGWMKLYGRVAQEEESSQEDGQNVILPEVKEGEHLNLLELKPEQHFTEPPPRYNDASLIKKLEELGIGRPSTYAPTLSTIQDRFYVERKERRFYPTPLGIAVTDFLLKNFADIIDYKFTAHLEGQLDEIAEGKREWKPLMREFYQPFAQKLEATGENAERVKIVTETVDKACPECGKPLQVRFGKFGKFLACSGFPDCKYTENFETKVDVPCPLDGGEVVIRKTKKGRPFYGCKNWPKCTFASWTKPGVKGGKTSESTEEAQS